MTDYILTHPTLMDSARIIAKATGLSIRTQVGKGIAPVIRWGNATQPFPKDTLLNSPEMILTSSSKSRFSAAMTRANIPCVTLQTGTPDHYPVVVRTVSGGHGGAGIVICETAEEFSNYTQYSWSYWTEFRWEIGVHVLGGRIVKVFTKLWDRVGDAPRYPIRNTELGWSFSRRRPEIYNDVGLPQFIERFYREFPIEMCRLDIGRVKGGLMLIECNSAPSLSANSDTAALYTSFLQERLK